jgi:hypothetical protein
MWSRRFRRRRTGCPRTMVRRRRRVHDKGEATNSRSTTG